VTGRVSYAVADITLTVIVENMCPALIACLINENIYCNVMNIGKFRLWIL